MGKQHMILPAPGDFQIGPGIAFALEAATRQKPQGGLVVRQAGGLDAMQPQGAEAMIEDGPDRFGHEALTGKGLADPVAEAGGIGITTADIEQAHPANQHIVGTVEDKIAIGLVGPRQRPAAPHALAEGSGREVALPPGRLPGFQKGARGPAQRQP